MKVAGLFFLSWNMLLLIKWNESEGFMQKLLYFQMSWCELVIERIISINQAALGPAWTGRPSTTETPRTDLGEQNMRKSWTCTRHSRRQLIINRPDEGKGSLCFWLCRHSVSGSMSQQEQTSFLSAHIWNYIWERQWRGRPRVLKWSPSHPFFIVSWWEGGYKSSPCLVDAVMQIVLLS